MADEFDQFDQFDEAQDTGAAQQPAQPQYATADDLAQRDYAIQQLARYVAQREQQGWQMPEPQQPPELRLRVNPETGGWESVSPDPPAPPDPEEAASQAVQQALGPYQGMLAAAEEQALSSRVQSAFDAVRERVPNMVFDNDDARFYAEQAAAAGTVATFEEALKVGIARSNMKETQRRAQYDAERKVEMDRLAEGRQEPEGAGPQATPAPQIPRGRNAYEQNQEQFFRDRALRMAGS